MKSFFASMEETKLSHDSFLNFPVGPFEVIEVTGCLRLNFEICGHLICGIIYVKSLLENKIPIEMVFSELLTKTFWTKD